MELSTVEEAVRDFRDGKFVVVVDDEDRENEGDLIMAAEKVTAERIAFMVRHTSGIICMPMTAERTDTLRLPQMVPENTESQRTAFTISVDYRHGTSTGISAADRARTIQALVDPASVAGDFLRPGHIFPLRGVEGGVLRRAGHTEAAVDLARLASLAPAGILCEIVHDDGTMRRLPALKEFAREHGLSIISIADLISYRRTKEKLVERAPESHVVSTRFGDFTAHSYTWLPDGTRSIALVMGEVAKAEGVLVRVHAECVSGDVFGAKTCKCDTMVDAALEKIAREGRGVFVYLRGPDGGGFRFTHSRAAPRDDSHNDWRETGVGSQILIDLGVRSLRILSNRVSRYVGLEGYGLQVVDRVPLQDA